MIPAGASITDALNFFTQFLGFTTTWQGEGGAGITRDKVSFNLVENNDQAWARNASFSIGVANLDVLYEEYRAIPALVGPLEVKAWGRREFHMIISSGVCLQFYELPQDSYSPSAAL